MLYHPLNVKKQNTHEGHEDTTPGNTTLTVNNSLLNNQNNVVNQILVPLGVNLGSSPSLPEIAGSLGYDFNNTPNSLWISNGTVWNEIRSQGAGEGNVRFNGSSVVANHIVSFSGTSGLIIQDSGSLIGTGNTIGTNNIIGNSNTIGTGSEIGSMVTIGDNTSISGSNTGDVTLTAIGTSPNGDGASLSGQALTLQPADPTHGGVVTNVAQLFGGLKNFSTSGIQLTPTANLGTASGIFNAYAYSYVAGNSYSGAVTGSCDTIFERVGNIITITLVNGLYNMTQVGATIFTSNPATTPFIPTNLSISIGPVYIIDSASTTGIAIGAATLNTLGHLSIGNGAITDTSTGTTYTLQNFSTGQSTGYGNGVPPGLTLLFHV